jgi:Holliday junction resolvase RusA-like endonuclease
VRPDVDKWLRQVLDALTGAVYRDDGQVVTVAASKVFADDDVYRTDIAVTVLPEAVAVRQPAAQLALAA